MVRFDLNDRKKKRTKRFHFRGHPYLRTFFSSLCGGVWVGGFGTIGCPVGNPEKIHPENLFFKVKSLLKRFSFGEGHCCCETCLNHLRCQV